VNFYLFSRRNEVLILASGIAREVVVRRLEKTERFIAGSFCFLGVLPELSGAGTAHIARHNPDGSLPT
jgi:hypothetical protein